MPSRRFVVLAGIAAAIAVRPASAQTPPGRDDLAAASPLHRAADRGDVDEIRRLCSAGAQANEQDRAGRTPLHVACFARQRDAMRALVACGADPRAREHQDYDCITIAAVADDLDTMTTALAIGGYAGEITSPWRGTALIAAAHLGHARIVDGLIRAGEPLDHVNTLGWTALIEAIVLGDGGPRHVETVKLLLAAGARRDLPDRQGVMPLELARRRGFTQIVAAFGL